MIRSSRLLAGAAVGAAVLASTALVATAQGSTSRAAAAKAVADSGTLWFSVTHVTNGLDHAAGNSSDKRLGTGVVSYSIKTIANTTGTVTIDAKNVTMYTGTGTLSGTATATLTITSTGDTITNGKLKLTKGAGSLKGDSLSGTFSGSGSTTANQYEVQYTGKLKKA